MDQNRNFRDWLILAGILALALALRLWRLDAPLWYDEILTVTRHLRLGWGEMLSSYSMNFHYLHNIQSKASAEILGETAWAIRLPAMVFGLAGIWAAWALAWYLAGRWVAHLSALLLAVSYHHIWFSQNARGYTELAFWGTLGMLLWLRGLKEPRPGLWLGYGLTLVLASFTHLTGAFLYAAQGVIWICLIFALTLRGQASRPLLIWPIAGYALGGVLTFLLYLPILPAMIETFSTVSDTSAVDVMKEYQSPIWTIYEALRTALGTAGPLVSAVGLLVLGLATTGGVRAKNARLFAPVVAMHIGLTILLLLALGMRIWPRFFFADVAFLMILIVMGVAAICAWMGRWPGLQRLAAALFPLAAVTMLVISAGLAARNYMAPKQDLAGAVALVEALRRPGEPVYAVGPAAQVFSDYYGMDWAALDNSDDWDQALEGPGSMIFVVAFPSRMFRTIPDLDATVDDGRVSLLADLPGTLGDGHVAVLRRDD
ncbi:MAG: glycosyltransferase family 39 protein [Mangrovicoccus sp.]